MHPSAYMPLYGNDFFSAVEGRTASVAVAYLRALWHYWHHYHCAGLPPDSDYLRRVCHADKDDWPSVEPVVFGKLFFQDTHGLWQQKRAQHEYAKALASYTKRLANSEALSSARWSTAHASAKDSPTESVTESATQSATDRNQNQKQNNNQKQSNSQTQNQERVNGASSAGEPNRSPSSRLERELMGQLRDLLGEDEMARTGGHWRVKWVRPHPLLLTKALEDLRLQIRERGSDFAECRAAWLTDLLKRWLPAPKATTPKCS